EAFEICRYLTRVVVDWRIFLHANQKAITIEWRVLQRSLQRFRSLLLRNHIEGWLSRRNNERDDVMDDLSIAGTRFRELHVLVFFEIRCDIEVLVFIRTARLDCVILGHLYDDVRFADTPAFFKLWRFG